MADDIASNAGDEQPKNNLQTVPNPIARAANITVSLPEAMEVKLVDASSLGEYEIWTFLSSIGSSALVGFLVATVQAAPQARDPYLWFTVVIAIITVLFVIMTFRVRAKLKKSARKLRFGIGDPIEEDAAGG